MPATPDRRELRHRRLKLAAVAAGIVLAAQLGLLPGPLQAVRSGVDTVRAILDPDPDGELRRLVDAGDLRPARAADVEAWIKASKLSPDGGEVSLYPEHAYVVLAPVTLPRNMHGAHSRSFIVPADMPIPTERERSHNDFYLLASGTCVGSAPGCSH